MTAAIAEIKAIDNAQYCPNVSVSKIPKRPLAIGNTLNVVRSLNQELF